MTKGELISLIVILVIFTIIILIVAGALTIFFVVSARHKKHFEYVRDHSELLRSAAAINGKYEFKNFKQQITIRQRFDNKGNWYRTEPVSLLTKEIREDFASWKETQKKIEYNKTQYPLYKKEIFGLKSTLTEEACKANKLSYRKCCEIENKLFDNLIKCPGFSVSAHVYMRYLSPKGKVDLTKEDVFNYVQISRIIDSVSSRRVDRETYKRLAQAERGVLTDSMRYDVMKRDGFRCVLCGMSRKDGAILHVDHIIPVSKGGKTEMKNLRTLCERCNLGKSNKIE